MKLEGTSEALTPVSAVRSPGLAQGRNCARPSSIHRTATVPLGPTSSCSSRVNPGSVGQGNFEDASLQARGFGQVVSAPIHAMIPTGTRGRLRGHCRGRGWLQTTFQGGYHIGHLDYRRSYIHELN